MVNKCRFRLPKVPSTLNTRHLPKAAKAIIAIPQIENARYHVLGYLTPLAQSRSWAPQSEFLPQNSTTVVNHLRKQGKILQIPRQKQRTHTKNPLGKTLLVDTPRPRSSSLSHWQRGSEAKASAQAAVEGFQVRAPYLPDPLLSC